MTTHSAVLEPTILSGYTPPQGVFDETLDASGQLRAVWKPFINRLNALGIQEIASRWDKAQSMLRENGIAFSAYADPHDPPRPWMPDVLPLLIAAREWQWISQALIQRAELLNRILRDLYGPQDIVRRGLLPPELVFLHPGFLRPLHAAANAPASMLTQYAADLARGADGSWWVLADRTEAPSGAGYALENRIVISRMMPYIFHSCHVERLAPYFIALRESLGGMATQHRDNPRVVLLSQGPESPNYFEDAYVARYLGYTLVEGGDLAVRGSRVLLKTLGGLLPVDVILRRPNSEFCDPLELAASGVQGPAGLLQAWRSGKVAIANRLGTGLAESPAMMAFLPRLSRELLGEDLMLPNLATWWCGDPSSLQYVLQHLEELTIRPAYRRRGQSIDDHRRLAAMNPAKLSEIIRAEPGAYVAQQKLTRSTTPVWSDGRMRPAHIAIRSFLAASDGSYTVMQGGLTRVSATSEPLEASILSGERSKDTWIVSDAPVQQISLLHSGGTAVELHRGGAELPSRVADNLFWLGRQVERSEASARLLRTTISRLTSEFSSTVMPEMPALFRAMAEQGQIEPGFVVEGIRERLPGIEEALPRCVLDESQPGSLTSTVQALFQTAGKVRDRISIDSWRIMQRIDLQWHQLRRRNSVDATDLLVALDDMIIDLAALSGLVMESMTRAQAWRFLDLGRRLERGLQTIYIVRGALATYADNSAPLLDALLEVADSLMTYRSRYLSNLQLAAVLDLLLTDETNPRSLAFQLVRISQHVDGLPRPDIQPMLETDQRLAVSLLHEIRMCDVLQLSEEFSLGQTEQLDRLLERMSEGLPQLSDAVSHKYLFHASPYQQLTALDPLAPI